MRKNNKRGNLEDEFHIGKALKFLRKKYNKSQWDLFHETGLTPDYISKIETGKIKDPRLITIKKLAKCFGITVAEFVKYAEKKWD